jgi:hypothetical protein
MNNIIDSSGNINIKGNIVETMNVLNSDFKKLNNLLDAVETELQVQSNTEQGIINPAITYLMWWLSFILNTGWFLVNCQDNYYIMTMSFNNKSSSDDYYNNFEKLINVFIGSFNDLYWRLDNIPDWYNGFLAIYNNEKNGFKLIEMQTLILNILYSHLTDLICYPYDLGLIEINSDGVPTNFMNKTDIIIIEVKCIISAQSIMPNKNLPITEFSKLDNNAKNKPLQLQPLTTGGKKTKTKHRR